ncbi:sodium:solute symporter family transporter [Carboxylicivirga taeanensis]|uniref:sodium:solute symporter family transporter n=1 Tax=Carboxylicivirga taeanensis TaxID=1416875 RepID=UPI003F6E42C5
MKDYAVGSVNFSPAFVGLSLAVSMTSAATFVINPGLIAMYGWSGVLSFGLFFPLATLVSLVVLTKSFRKYGQSVKAISLAQWIGTRYNSKVYLLFMGLLSILLITFIVLILVAITKVLSKGIAADEIWVLAAVVVFVFGYMMFGGANSLVYTNSIQAIVMLLVAVILLGSGYEHLKDGVDEFWKSLASINPLLTKNVNAESPLFRDFFEIAFTQTVVGIAVVIQPHIITKSLFLKKENDVNRFLLTAILAEILFFSVVIVGLYARLTFPELQVDGVALNTDDIIPSYVIQIFNQGWFSVIVGLVVILGLLSAGFSTLEGLIQSLSTSWTTDIIKPIFGRFIPNEQSYFRINKGMVVLLAFVSFLMAWNQLINPKLSVAILAQNGVYAYFSVAFVPVIMGIFTNVNNWKLPFSASMVALITHFGIYYILPWLIKTSGLYLGWATPYLQGEVRNPAIASSMAISLSSLVGLVLYLREARKIKKYQLSNEFS